MLVIHTINYNDVTMSALVSQITSLTNVYSTVYSRRISKNISKPCITGLCAGIHRWPLKSQHKGPVNADFIPFDDVIMFNDSGVRHSLIHVLFNHSTSYRATPFLSFHGQNKKQPSEQGSPHSCLDPKRPKSVQKRAHCQFPVSCAE